MDTVDHYLQGGRAMQRFWLTATSLELQFQPEMTPLIFSRYVCMSENFTLNAKANQQARVLSEVLGKLTGDNMEKNRVFMGRIGVGKYPLARSTRMSVDELII